MTKIVVSLRSVFFYNAWYFQHEKPEISKTLKVKGRCRPRWKLHLPHRYRTLVTPGRDGKPGRYANKRIDLSLFDMVADPYETRNVIKERPEIAAKLKALAEEHRRKFFGGSGKRR